MNDGLVIHVGGLETDKVPARNQLTLPSQTPPTPHLPLVSIIITNHNYRDYVCTAIASVRCQEYPYVECIVVDDASTDDSDVVIGEAIRQTSSDKFSFVKLAKNVGQMGAMKAGIERCSGEFVVFLDADDVLLPDFVRLHLAAHLNISRSAGVSASDVFQISEDGSIVEGTCWWFCKHRGEQTVFSPGRDGWRVDPEEQVKIEEDSVIYPQGGKKPLFYINRDSEFPFNGVAMSSYMFRRDLVSLILPQNVKPLRICADYYVVVYSHRLAGTLVIPTPLSCWRVHGRNNYASLPKIGGQSHVGTFTLSRQTEIERQIFLHLKENVNRIAPLVGVEWIKEIANRINAKRSHTLQTIDSATDFEDRVFACNELPCNIEHIDEYDGRISVGVPGHLVYGPYLKIVNEDRYIAELLYSTTDASDNQAGVFDIAINHKCLTEVNLPFTSNKIKAARIVFDTTGAFGHLLETRVMVNKGVKLKAQLIHVWRAGGLQGSDLQSSSVGQAKYKDIFVRRLQKLTNWLNWLNRLNRLNIRRMPPGDLAADAVELDNRIFACTGLPCDIEHIDEIDGRISQGAPGCLVYGPYVKIKREARYIAELLYSTDGNSQDSVGIFDVTINQKIVSEIRLRATDNNVKRARVVFETSHLIGQLLETRVMAERGVRLKAQLIHVWREEIVEDRLAHTQ
jgi:glycosyltransferase involved in cell wall biosynthesis